MAWSPDRGRLYRLALREFGRALLGKLGGLGRIPSFRAASPGRLLFVPQDLRTSDPTVATDIYAGLFVFMGRSVATGGRPPFAVPPPSRPWAEALYGFGWLRHLRAADTPLARANARALADEFISGRAGDRRLARETHIVARRIISFLTQSPLVLDRKDHEFYRRFLRSLGRDIRELERDLRGGVPAPRRLMAIIGLCYANLCCEGREAALQRTSRLLAPELDKQVLADGGHVSRNPRLLVELLLDLLPLRQLYASRGIEPPRALLGAIDRMLPMLRLLRHGDGTLALFNGMGVTAVDHLATLLSFDPARPGPMKHAPYAGYERLEAEATLVLADVGGAPEAEHSTEAHAGCLSFELSSGLHRLVVNCGTPRTREGPSSQAARLTAAHSVACVAETSSARFLAVQGWGLERMLAAWLERRLGPIIVSGPRILESERGEEDGAIRLWASHDGYRSRFGVVHRRSWTLSPGGDRLDGEDSFQHDSRVVPSAEVLIRFHLHPAVKASRILGGPRVTLILPNREAWQFEASGPEPQLEESVFFAATDGTRRTEQIVVPLKLSEATSVQWRFERLAPGSDPGSDAA